MLEKTFKTWVPQRRRAQARGRMVTPPQSSVPSTTGSLHAPKPTQDKAWPLDTLPCQPQSARPARQVAGRTETVMCALPHFEPQSENPKLQQRSVHIPRMPWRSSGGWPKLGRVARVVTSSRIARGWLTNNLHDSRLEGCFKEETVP